MNSSHFFHNPSHPQTTKMSYQIGLYQIGISTDNKTKLESETFGIKDDKLR